jgi:hypothetical protein
MQITLTRSGEHTYRTTALRDDGVTLEVASSDRTFLLPHDIAHYVVERELGLQRGFWGCVAAGALFDSIKVISGRQPPHAAERSRAIIREARRDHGPEAEEMVSHMVRIMDAGLDSNWPAAQAVLARMYQPRKPSRGPLRAEEVQRVCGVLREVQQHWQALLIGESLVVFWPGEKQIPWLPRHRLNRRSHQER